jgi:hypothetical protein
MISSAKNNLQRGTGKIFLLWGYLVVLVSLLNLLLLLMLPAHDRYFAYCAWCIMPLGLFFHYRLIRKLNDTSGLTTYTEQILGYVWTAFSISVVTIVLSMILASIPGLGEADSMSNLLYWFHWIFLIPVMLILYGFALFVSGRAYRFMPMVLGSMVCWAMSFLLLLLLRHDRILELQLVALIVSVLAGYVIPGHMLRNKENSHV